MDSSPLTLIDAETYRKHMDMLLHAFSIGDKRAALYLSLIVIADNAILMKEAQERIFDLYDEHFDDLSSIAHELVPIPTAARIERLKELIEGFYEEVDFFADESMSVVKEINEKLKK